MVGYHELQFVLPVMVQDEGHFTTEALSMLSQHHSVAASPPEQLFLLLG